MSKENRIFDLEDRLIDFYFCKKRQHSETKYKENFMIQHSLFDIRYSKQFYAHLVLYVSKFAIQKDLSLLNSFKGFLKRTDAPPDP